MAAVTGGSGGLGRALVTEFQSLGYEVHDLSRSAGIDASDEAQVVEAFARFGRLEVLVNNAAVLRMGLLVDMDAAAWDETLNAGLRAAFLCSREAFRRMPPGGAIVNVSSLSGVVGTEKFAGMAAYVAAKSGLAGLTEALAVEGRPLGIRVNAVSPGAIDTAMLKKSGVGGASLQPTDVARLVGWLATSRSAPLTGANLRLDP
ncbi:MAG: SDR family oxidoreductase [Candidatus Dormibacteraeota bacterium]|nr:SDR family oxidoreductase [Candidatus Dormibacteraeota bacterium]